MTSTANDQCFWVFCFCFLDFPTYFSLKYIFLIWREKCFIKLNFKSPFLYMSDLKHFPRRDRGSVINASLYFTCTCFCYKKFILLYNSIIHVPWTWWSELYRKQVSVTQELVLRDYILQTQYNIYIFSVFFFFFILSQKFSEDWKVLNAYYIFWWINYVHLYNYI